MIPRFLPYACTACLTLWTVGASSGAAVEPTENERAALADLGRRITGLVAWESNRTGAWELYVMSVDGSGFRQLTHLAQPGDGRAYDQYLRPQFSPDGRTLLFAYGRKGAPCEAWLCEVASGESRRLTVGLPLNWSSDGASVYVLRDAGVYAVDVRDGTEGRVDPATAPADGRDGSTVGSLSPDGRSLVLRTPRANEYFVFDAAKTVKTFGGCEIRFGEDGRHIYWVQGPKDFRVWDRETDEEHQLLGQPPVEPYNYTYFPTVSRDGSYLVYGASPNQHDHDRSDYEVYLQPLDGWSPSGAPVRLTFDDATDRWPSLWLAQGPPTASGTDAESEGASPATDDERQALARLRGRLDGQIVWESNRSGAWRIWTMNADGMGVRQLSQGPGDDTEARFSPDGKTIAFTRTERGERAVWLMGRDGGDARKLIDDAGSPVFTRDGQRLHFARKREQRGEHFDTWVYDIGTGTQRRVFPPDGAMFELDVWGAEASDDESRFVAWSPRPRGTWVLSADGTVRAHVHSGCQGQVSPDQRYGYGVKSAGTFIRFDLADGGNPLEFNVREGDWIHTYFPRVSADGQWLVYAACPPTQHDHDTSDYELFIVRLDDWQTRGEPVRLTFSEATDRAPDIHLSGPAVPDREYDLARRQPAPVPPLPLLTFGDGRPDGDAGRWGTWPAEGDVSIRAAYVNADAEGGAGGAVRIEYEIRGEPNSVALWLSPANGRLDLRGYDGLALWARGTVPSFTVVIEDASATQEGGSRGVGDIRVTGVTGEWQRFELPLAGLVPREAGGTIDLGAIRTLAVAAIAPRDARKGTLEIDNLMTLPRE